MSWRGWTTTRRLLAFTMPISILLTAWLGWWIGGLSVAAAVLFAAAMAPTDPVLAVDVQTGPPTTGDPDADEPDEVRFGLTSESSLNDGSAFPFVNLAILLAVFGLEPGEWLTQWTLVDVLDKIVGGVVIGWVVGKVLGWVTIRLVGGKGFAGMCDDGEGLAPAVMALAYTLVSFGITEVADGLDRQVTWEMIVLGLVLVLIARPLAAWLGLLGHRGASPATSGWCRPSCASVVRARSTTSPTGSTEPSSSTPTSCGR